MKKELKSLPEHPSLFHLKWDSFYANFILPCSVSCIIVCLFLIGHCIVCAFTISDYSFGIFKHLFIAPFFHAIYFMLTWQIK